MEVSGYLAPDWEGPTLFLTSEQCWRYSEPDGIGVRFSAEIWKKLASVRNRWCHLATVVGVFDPIPFEEPQENVIRIGSWNALLNEAAYLRVE